MTQTPPPSSSAVPPLAPWVRVEAGLQVAFTTVGLGNLALHVAGSDPAPDPAVHRRRVERRRVTLDDLMQVPRGRTEYLDQVHSATVVPARGQGWGPSAPPPAESGASALVPEQADARVSASGADPLAVMVADCLPVVFVSRRAGQAQRPGEPAWGGPTAVAHAGRRGLLDGVLEATVQAMHRAGAATGPGGIQAWIGPAVCGDCYEVPQDMHDSAVAQIPALDAHTSWGTPSLDLPAGAQSLLEALGVQVHQTGLCTFEDESYYSHRREPGAGRLAGLVWRTAA